MAGYVSTGKKDASREKKSNIDQLEAGDGQYRQTNAKVWGGGRKRRSTTNHVGKREKGVGRTKKGQHKSHKKMESPSFWTRAAQ